MSNIIKLNEKLLENIPVDTIDTDFLINNIQKGGYTLPEVRVPIHTYDESIDKFVNENKNKDKSLQKEIVSLNMDLFK